MKRTIIALLLILLLVPTMASATVLPATYHGTVTISGQPAPAGTVIQASVNGIWRASTTVVIISAGGKTQAIYEIAVPTGPEGGLVAFQVGGLSAAQRAAFVAGSVSTLNLTVIPTWRWPR